jgi:hypothetical protein
MKGLSSPMPFIEGKLIKKLFINKLSVQALLLKKSWINM